MRYELAGACNAAGATQAGMIKQLVGLRGEQLIERQRRWRVVRFDLEQIVSDRIREANRSET